jgi:nucleotidyltransferase substrate binding protein (TIGR01987 family)
MSVAKAELSVANLRRGLDRLQEALDEPLTNSLVIDGTIQRFEFVIELYWKTLKRLLFLNGIEAGTPREALSEAYRAGWIDNETAWLEMLRDRNETSHIYNEAAARRIYERIRENNALLQQTWPALRSRIPKTTP